MPRKKFAGHFLFESISRQQKNYLNLNISNILTMQAFTLLL